MIRISAAESQVMEVLWRRGPLTNEDLIAELGPQHQWGAATVKTLITRLLKKRAISSQRGEGRQVYSPLLKRDDYVQTESQGLLDRLFEGRLTPLVAHFAEHRALKADEIKRLRKLLEDLDDAD
jgi:BlaI family transcriptional regulator, penicillinase repressor